MVTIEGFASLSLVKEQIDESLNLAQSSLERFVEESGEDSQLKTAIEQFSQIKGVFLLINLPGASMLSGELEQLIHKVLAHHDQVNERLLAAATNAIMVLMHYLEYVEAKKRALPILLIPTINEVRFLLCKPLITESCFFHFGAPVENWPQLFDHGPDMDQIASKGRRLRHMYQVGLLGLLKNENPVTNARTMIHAVSRFAKLCGNTPISKFWWLVLAILEAIENEYIQLNVARKALLGTVDRHIKQVINGGENALKKEPAQSTVQECVYIASIAGSRGERLQQVQSLFQLDTEGLTDETISHELEIMRGPGGSVIRSVAQALNEELTQIKDALDLGARGATDDNEGFESIAESILRVSNTLVMLGLSKAAGDFKIQADVVRHWSKSDINAESSEFNKVADALLYVENSVATLLPRKGPDNQLYNHSTAQAMSEGMSVTQLDEAMQVVVAEARAGLSLAKRAITSFMDSNWDTMHLSNVSVTLKAVWGGLIFLQLQRAAAVVTACEKFIVNELIRENAAPPSYHVMETLADAITSIDYYLEGMEDDKPIGEGILEVAEESMHELGFPVKAA